MDYRTDMARYIISIFNHYLPVVFSWGISRMKAIDYGVRFHVQGFVHKGNVEVVYVEGNDTFTIRTLNDDGSIKREEEYVYLDCLVNVIDNLVEKASTQEEYEKRINAEYGWQ